MKTTTRKNGVGLHHFRNTTYSSSALLLGSKRYRCALAGWFISHSEHCDTKQSGITDYQQTEIITSEHLCGQQIGTRVLMRVYEDNHRARSHDRFLSSRARRRSPISLLTGFDAAQPLRTSPTRTLQSLVHVLHSQCQIMRKIINLLIVLGLLIHTIASNS